MTCFICKGDTEDKRKTYVANLDRCVIIVKNVPAMVCRQCGEVYYTDHTAEQLEDIVDRLEKIIEEVVIVEYSNLAS